MKLRRFLALFLAFVLAFPLFGCTETVPEGMVAVYLQAERITQYANYTLRERCEYDGNGNRLVLANYDRYGVESRREEISYNDHNQSIAGVIYEYGKETARYTGKLEYDSKGREISSIYYVNDIESSRTSTKYDDNVNIVEETSSYDGGKTQTVKTYQYDASGRLIEETTGNGTTIYNRRTYLYSGDLLIESISTGRSDGLTERTVYEYDANGNELRKSFYLDDDLRSYDTKEYDSFGNIIRQERIRSDSGLQGTWVWEYDDNGHLTRHAYYINNVPTPKDEKFYNEHGKVYMSIERTDSVGEIIRTYTYACIYMTPEQAERFQ